MVSEHVKILSDVMMGSHPEDAEAISRQRAKRCAQQLEPKWAATWIEVADYIAKI
jgi:hypothetical protein